MRAFRGLGAADRAVLESRCEVVRIPCGAVLFEQGESDRWVYLLLKGELDLLAQDGCSHRMMGGSAEAERLISRLKPRLHTATARSATTLLRIDGSSVGFWHSCVDTPIRHWERLADSMHLQRGGEVLAKAASGLEVPRMPAIALKARALIERDECDAQAVANLLRRDPSMASKLIRVANSPLFYGAQAVSTCDRAIVRLGLKTTRFMIIAFAVRELFDMQAPGQSHLVRELWDHSTEVAAIASVLAHRSAAFDPGEAQLAGLLHDVGVIPVLDAASRRPELGNDPEGVMAMIVCQRAAMGSHILQRWNFSPALIAATVEAESWHRDAGKQADLADLVVVAQLLSFIGKRRITDASAVLELPACRKVLGTAMLPEQVLEFLDEFGEPIEEIRTLLRS